MAAAIPAAPVVMETLGSTVTSSTLSPPEVSLTLLYPQQPSNSTTAPLPKAGHKFDLLWCNECRQGYLANCPTHGPLVKIRDREIPSKAKLTVPHMLSLKGLGLSSNGHNLYSVVAKKIVQKRTMFGPFDAPVVDTEPPEDPHNKQLVLKLFEVDGSCMWVDQRSEDQCNWMIYVQAARYVEEINTVAFQYKDKLYFTTTKVIAPNQELKVWYGEDYREWMGIPQLPRLQGDSDDECEDVGGVEVSAEEWNCSLCQTNFMTFEELEEHRCPAVRASRSRANSRRKGRPPVKRLHSKLISTRSSAKRKERLSAAAMAAKKRKALPKIQPTKVPKPVFECVYCGKAVCGESAYKVHLSIHTGKKPFVCEYQDCSKGFTSKYKLERHALIHSDSKDFKCAFCERSFNRKDHLKIHLAVHDQNRKPNMCDICGKEYSSNVTFRTHMALHAAENGDRVCKICGKDFETKDDLIFHIRIHSGSRLAKMPSDKQQNCPHCDKKFFTKKDVKRHLIVHTKKKDYLCQFCPQRFGRKDHLTRHIRATHVSGVLKMEDEEGEKEPGRPTTTAKAKKAPPPDPPDPPAPPAQPAPTAEGSALQTALQSPPITPVLLMPNTSRMTAGPCQVPLTIPGPSPAPHSVPPAVLDPATVIASGQPLRHLVYATGPHVITGDAPPPGPPPPPILHPVPPTPQSHSMPANNLPQPLPPPVNQIRTLPPPNTDLQHGFNQRLNTLYNNKFCNPPQSIEAMVGYIETLKFLENLPTVGPPPHGHPMTNPSQAAYTSGYLVPPEVHLPRPSPAFPQPPGMVPAQISQPSHLTVVPQHTAHSVLSEHTTALAMSQPNHVSPHIPLQQPAPTQLQQQYR